MLGQGTCKTLSELPHDLCIYIYIYIYIRAVNLFTFLQDRAALLLNMQNVHGLYYLLLN